MSLRDHIDELGGGILTAWRGATTQETATGFGVEGWLLEGLEDAAAGAI